MNLSAAHVNSLIPRQEARGMRQDWRIPLSVHDNAEATVADSKSAVLHCGITEELGCGRPFAHEDDAGAVVRFQ